MIKMLTVFAPCENVHLVKDVGMIPYMLKKKFDYEVTLASYDNGEYPYLETEVVGLRQSFIPKLFNHQLLDVLLYILLNFRKYEVLQCYHLTKESAIALTLFKLLRLFHQNKVTYLKLDVDDQIRNFRFHGISGYFFRGMMQKISLITVETEQLSCYLNEHNTFGREVSYVTNGFYDGESGVPDVEHKENIILTVGRIGAEQKSNEILLEAFRQFASIEQNWRLVLAGPVEESFRSSIEQYFNANPLLREKVFFTGNITDRKQLDEWYYKARIFVLTSKWEGFPLVFLEALHYGCTICSTAITAAYDATDNGRVGKLFPVDDANALLVLLKQLTQDIVYLQNNARKSQQLGYEKFYWPVITSGIHKLLTPHLASQQN